MLNPKMQVWFRLCSFSIRWFLGEPAINFPGMCFCFRRCSGQLQPETTCWTISNVPVITGCKFPRPWWGMPIMHISYIYILIHIYIYIFSHAHIFTYISYHLQENRRWFRTPRTMNSTQNYFTNSSDFLQVHLCGSQYGWSFGCHQRFGFSDSYQAVAREGPTGGPDPSSVCRGRCVSDSRWTGWLLMLLGVLPGVESSESAGCCVRSLTGGFRRWIRRRFWKQFGIPCGRMTQKISKIRVHRRMSWHVMAHQLKWGMLQMFAKNLTMKSWSCKKYRGCSRFLFKCLPMPCMGLGWYMVPLFRRNPFKDTLIETPIIQSTHDWRRFDLL